VLNELVRLLIRDDHEARELSTDDTPEQTLHYIRGLGHFFENQYEAAIAEFMMLVGKDPDSELARYWLVRAYGELKDYPHCAIECQSYLEAFPDGEHVEEVRAILQACKKATEATNRSPPRTEAR
jgi:TolA-binding protein